MSAEPDFRLAPPADFVPGNVDLSRLDTVTGAIADHLAPLSAIEALGVLSVLLAAILTRAPHGGRAQLLTRFVRATKTLLPGSP